MKLTWLGHACFKLECQDGVVVFDPFKDHSVPGLKVIRENADLVLCSHEHDDHYGIECVATTGNDTSFVIHTIDSFHDNQNGSLRGKNIIHIVETEGMKVVHLGDIGCDFDTSLIRNCDVLLIPIGGYYTIDSNKALELINQIQPRVTIPMHYKGDSFGYPVLSTIDEFIKQASNPVFYDSNVMTIDSSTCKQTAILDLHSRIA